MGDEEPWGAARGTRGTLWSERDVKDLRKYVHLGYTDSDIGKKIGRSPRSVAVKRQRLGLVIRKLDSPGYRIEEALDIAFCYGSSDGEHHKAWVIDQMVRALIPDLYVKWVESHNAGEDGADTYSWPTGIAP